MSKLPRITGKKLVQALEKEGFEISRQRGSHVQVRKWAVGEKIFKPSKPDICYERSP